jgi:predicted hydrocarbon binding protein/KaiC/GvpD/RAD55 family RecA-like ATPase
MSLAKVQEPPDRGVTLLIGPPGAGKSAFCHKVVLNGLAADRPVIFVTTDQDPDQTMTYLSERGLARAAPGTLSFVDAFSQTVGVKSRQRPDTVHATCMDLNSISIAVTRLQERMGRRGIVLAFDSLTSPYLLSGSEMPRFVRLFLSRFAAEGNSVVALIDEGCGRPEDLVAMMSVADSVIKMERTDGKQVLEVVKHLDLAATRIEIPAGPGPTIRSAFEVLRAMSRSDRPLTRKFVRSMMGQGEEPIRSEVGDSVHLYWPAFAHWSVMLWDPKRFPRMIYELNKQDGAFATSDEMRRFLPYRLRFVMAFLGPLQALGVLPREFSEVRDMRRLGAGPWDVAAESERSGTLEYLDEISKTDEHYFRAYESADCWAFRGVGHRMAWHLPPHMAGQLAGLERDGGDWDAVETRCIGLGDPYCEFKLVPAGTDELSSSLEKDSDAVETIHGRLTDRLTGFILDGTPLVDKRSLGNTVNLHPVIHGFGFPYTALDDRYRVALQMGGARAGKTLGERLVAASLDADEALRRVLDFLDHCKAGKVQSGETIKIKDNCESLATALLREAEAPACYFTMGFLGGLLGTLKGQHVREVRCAAMGDPYCEWELV